MKNRVDEVFVLERLRRAWEGPAGGNRVDGPKDGAGTPTGEPAMAFQAAAVFARLQEAVSRRFPGSRGEALQPLLVELEQRLARRLPIDSRLSAAREECAGINWELEDLLNQIEDLVEALEIG